jgi:hypothetical protein
MVRWSHGRLVLDDLRSLRGGLFGMGVGIARALSTTRRAEPVIRARVTYVGSRDPYKEIVKRFILLIALSYSSLERGRCKNNRKTPS